jgi:hypothetical protein
VITTCNDGPVETAQDAYHRMLRDELAPRLESLGLTGPTDEDSPQYAWPAPGYHALIGPHEYWANSAYSFQFTMNVLLVSHTDWDTYLAANGADPGTRPHVNTHYGRGGPWIERIGRLMGSGDKWWYVSPRRQTLPIAEEVAFVIGQAALPELIRRTA